VQIDRTVSNNKRDITIGNKKTGTCVLIDAGISGDRNVTKKEAEKYRACGCKNKCDTRNNRGKWNYFKIIQKVPEQHTRNARYHGTAENSHIEHCTHISKY
jgi:hypothetical protein